MRERKYKKAKEELICDCQKIMHRNKISPRFLKRVIAVNMEGNLQAQRHFSSSSFKLAVHCRRTGD